MTIWKRILQGVTALSLDTIITMITGVLGAMLVFRYLSPAEYGQLALFLSYYAVGMVFFSFGLGSVFTAEIARSRGSHNKSWAKYLINYYGIFLFITATLILFVFIGIGRWQGELTLWSIIGVFLWVSAPNELARILFLGTTRYRRVAGQSMTRSVSRLCWLVTLPWWWGGQPLVGVALTYPLMELSAGVFTLYFVRFPWSEFKGISTSAHNFKQLYGLLRKQGMYVVLSTPLKKIANELPIWMLKLLLGDMSVGLYAAARRAYSLVSSFFNSLESTLFPLVSEQATSHSARLQIALRQAQKYSFWAGVLVAIGGGLFAPLIILFISGQEYMAAVPLLILMFWRLPLYAFVQSQRPIFYAIGEQKSLFISYLIITIIEALSLIILLPLMGTIGAVVALLLRTVASIAIRLSLTSRLAPHLWVEPWSIVKIEDFDVKVWQNLRKTTQRMWKTWILS